MIEPQYIRVNVTSATADTRENESGDLVAEMDMQLPSNLVVNADKVESARMAVMKMQIPLAKLPAVTIPVNGWSESIDHKFYIQTPLLICPIPYDIIHGVNQTTLNSLWNRLGDNQLHPCRIVTETLQQTSTGGLNPAEIEYRRGYHEIATMQKFLQILSLSLVRSIEINFNFNDSQYTSDFNLISDHQFTVHADNTISLTVTPFCSGIILPTGFQYHLPSRVRLYRKTTPVSNTYYQYCIAVNEDVKVRLPTLPWIRFPVPPMLSPNWDGSGYMYVLDTTAVSIHRSIDSMVLDAGLNETAYSTPVEYHFTESDAITNIDLNSIVLLMNGVAFNQQVFPVNFTSSSSKQAQTGTVPIIEVYYPLWSKPSDKTTNLIITKDTFSDAAPININPNLLKERFIKFKVMCITTSGEMRDLIIPKGNPFSFQIVFELNLRR